MNGEINKKTGFVAIVLLAIGSIIIIALTYFYVLKPKPPVVNNLPQAPQVFGDLTQVIDASEIPGTLPKDLPFEKGVPLLRNEMVWFSNRGEIHSIRSYYSNLPMETIFSDFKKYFDANKWKTLSTVDEENSKFLLVMKDTASGTIQLNVSKNQIDGRVLVEVEKVDQNSNKIDPPPVAPKN